MLNHFPFMEYSCTVKPGSAHPAEEWANLVKGGAKSKSRSRTARQP
jgi:hypothetical protein